MAMWDPWRGCHKYSEGCLHCYIHKGDYKRKVDTNNITKTTRFDAPLKKKKDGSYVIKPGSTVYICFSSDFFIEEADQWRDECWKMIKKRSDLHFLFLTKRIIRFYDCVPKDWGNGYPNVTIGCTVENQKNVDERLSFFQKLPIAHKNIICQPLIEKIDIEQYLGGIELVVVGGESDYKGRPMDYDWVLSLRKQCINQKTSFDFRQCSTYFIKNNKGYKLETKELIRLAKKANINVKF